MYCLKLKIKKNKHIAIETIILCLLTSIAYCQSLHRIYTSPSQLALGSIKAVSTDNLSLSANFSIAGQNETQPAHISAGIHNSQFLPELKTIYLGAYLPGKTSREHFKLSFGQFGFSAYNIKIIDLAYARKVNEHLSISANFASSYLIIQDYGKSVGFSVSLGFSGQLSTQTSFGVVMDIPSQKLINIDINSRPQIDIALRHQLSAMITLYAGINNSYIHSLKFSSGLEYNINNTLSVLCGFSVQQPGVSFGLKLPSGEYLIEVGSSLAFISGTQVSVAVSHPI